MARTLSFTDTSTQIVKIGDTTTSFTMVLGEDSNPVDLTNATSIVAKLGNSTGYLKSQTVTSDNIPDPLSGQVIIKFDPDFISGLPAGSYLLEVWVTYNSGVAIYPSGDPTGFTINNNIESQSGSVITTISYDNFVEAMNKAASTIAKGDKGDPGNYVPETFTNLAAIQSKYPNGSNGIMIAADNGHKYIWANNAWADAGVYQAVGIAEKSITAPMTNFLIKASILTDDITVKIDESLKSNIGLDFYSATLDNPGNIVWYKVPVTGGRSYSAYYHNMPKLPTQLVITEFQNGASIKRYSVPGDNPTFIVDSATDYVHISINSSKADYTAVKIILSEASSNIGKNAIETDNSWEARLTKAESEFDDSLTTTTAITTSIRYNYEYSENRLYVDGLEKDKYIERNGDIKDYPGWALSDYLPVEKNEIYVWTYDIPTKHTVANVYCGLFDVNRKYIGSGNQATDTDENKVLIKTDSNTAYVRISQDLPFFTSKNAMLIRKALYDQEITEFIPFKRYLKNSPTKEIEKKTNSLDTNYQPNYDNVVRSIQRIGAGMEHPIHSVEAFKDAYRKGFRILLCDLIFTSDNVPVCNHDSYLNENYKNVYDSNGALVSTDNPVYFSQNTYTALSKYNYGAMGYPLLKFTDMLKLVKQLGVELYVEVKGMTEQQAKIACSLVRQFGLSDKTSWAGGTKHLPWVIANLDTARVALMPSDVTDDVIEELNSLKTGKNKVFIFGWDTTILTDETVNKLMQNDIAFEQGTPNTEQDIKNYFARGDQYYYCTGIETNAVIAGKVLLESSLSNAE